MTRETHRGSEMVFTPARVDVDKVQGHCCPHKPGTFGVWGSGAVAEAILRDPCRTHRFTAHSTSGQMLGNDMTFLAE